MTLFSVLSVLLTFSALCFGVLMFLNRMDIVYFPASPTETASDSQGEEHAVSLPIRTEKTSAIPYSPIGPVSYRELALQSPFIDSYYLKIRVVNRGEERPYSGIYEIWRFGEKYRINRYSDQDEVEYMLTCDGDRVQVVDFGTLSASYYLMNDGFAFDDVAPLPSLRVLLEQEYELFEYEETDTLCLPGHERKIII